MHDTWLTSQVSPISSNLLAIVLAVQAHLWLETKAIHKLLKETVRASLVFGWDKEWLECLQKTRDVSESISDVKLQAKESFHLRMLCILLLCLRQGWCEPGKRRQLLYLETPALLIFYRLLSFDYKCPDDRSWTWNGLVSSKVWHHSSLILSSGLRFQSKIFFQNSIWKFYSADDFEV